jgi:hypothetical protein
MSKPVEVVLDLTLSCGFLLVQAVMTKQYPQHVRSYLPPLNAEIPEQANA